MIDMRWNVRRSLLSVFQFWRTTFDFSDVDKILVSEHGHLSIRTWSVEVHLRHKWYPVCLRQFYGNAKHAIETRADAMRFAESLGTLIGCRVDRQDVVASSSER